MKRNNSMKRVLAMLLVIIMVVTGSGIAMAKAGGNGNGAKGDAIGTMGTVSADAVKNNGKAVGKTKNAAKAKALYDLGLFKGISQEKFIPALESGTTRISAIVMIGRLIGWNVMDTTTPFKYANEPIPDDVVGKSTEEIRSVQYALANDITNGIGNGHFGSDLPINARMLYTWYARALMNVEVWTDLSKLVDLGFITAEQLIEMNLTSPLIRDDLVGVMYESLNWKMKNNDMKLFQYMLKNMWFDYKAVVRAGLTDPEEETFSFDVKQLSEQTLHLTFSHALDAGIAGTNTNYAVQLTRHPINNTTGAGIVVTPGGITVYPDKYTVNPTEYTAIADGKEVWLSFKSPFLVGDKVYVTPSTNVKSAIGGFVLDASRKTDSVTINEDNTKPAVSEINVVNSNQLQIVFSEPITTPIGTIPGFITMKKDGDTAITVRADILYSFGNANTELFLTVPSSAPFTAGTWRVEVAAGLTDQDVPANVSNMFSKGDVKIP